MQITESATWADLAHLEAAGAARPTAETSRLLLKLVEIAHEARTSTGNDNPALEGIISPGMLKRLLTTLNLRDVVTVQHSRRVSKLAVGIARHLRWEEPALRKLEVAALLHDIGKIGVPDAVLFKPGKLSHDEADLMALHHRVSVNLLQAARVDSEVIQIISQSRDFSCGAARGPGIAPAALHQGARILSVADAYDSLRSDLPYHKAKSHDDTVKILQENTGTQFDGNVINALARWAGKCGLNKCRDYQAEHRPPETGPAAVDSPEAADAEMLSRIFSHLYLLENQYDAFYLVDADQQFIVWNEGAERLVGQPAERLIDRPWTSRTICYADDNGREIDDDELPLREALTSGQPVARKVKILNAAGRWTEVELQSIPLIDESGHQRGAAELLRDTSRRDLAPHEYREKQRAAGRDALTGVANRTELKAQISQLLDTAVKEDWQYHFGLIFVEIDHFKQINDRFGHEIGDRVLIETARLLQQETYSGEIVGRHDGGQFMIVCPSTGGEQAAQRADRIHLALRNLHLEELEEWALTGSFGVTQATSGDTVEGLLNRADKALYLATHAGRNQSVYLSPNELSEPLLRENEAGSDQGTFEFQTQFLSCTAAEMIVFKLGGFVREVEARVLEVSAERVRLRLGRTGMFSGWGRADDRKPVDIELTFSSEVPFRSINGKKVKSNQVQVQVKIVPVGRVKSREVFHDRARQVLKDLSNFFMADVV
ncbi:MAG: diguanylate cyclase [Planctomycetia bacterium]|nr:diguanylate cyclase [Planctomycetia bacterium]